MTQRASTERRLPPDPADVLPPFTTEQLAALGRGVAAADIPPSVWDGPAAGTVQATHDGVDAAAVAAAMEAAR